MIFTEEQIVSVRNKSLVKRELGYIPFIGMSRSSLVERVEIDTSFFSSCYEERMEDRVSILFPILFEDVVGHQIDKDSQRRNSLRSFYSKTGIVLEGHTL